MYGCNKLWPYAHTNNRGTISKGTWELLHSKAKPLLLMLMEQLPWVEQNSKILPLIRPATGGRHDHRHTKYFFPLDLSLVGYFPCIVLTTHKTEISKSNATARGQCGLMNRVLHSNSGAPCSGPGCFLKLFSSGWTQHPPVPLFPLLTITSNSPADLKDPPYYCFLQPKVKLKRNRNGYFTM